MSVGQLREALMGYRPDAPVMIHPTGDPDDPIVPLSHLGRGATFPLDGEGFPTGEAAVPYPLLVVAPGVPHLVAEDVPAGEAQAVDGDVLLAKVGEKVLAAIDRDLGR